MVTLMINFQQSSFLRQLWLYNLQCYYITGCRYACRYAWLRRMTGEIKMVQFTCYLLISSETLGNELQDKVSFINIAVEKGYFKRRCSSVNILIVLYLKL